MKIRLTWGNIFGALTTIAGFVVGHSDVITAASPRTGATIVTAGAVILGLTKGLISNNPDQIPANKTVNVAPGVMLEKTGPLKPQTP